MTKSLETIALSQELIKEFRDHAFDRRTSACRSSIFLFGMLKILLVFADMMPDAIPILGIDIDDVGRRYFVIMLNLALIFNILYLTLDFVFVLSSSFAASVRRLTNSVGEKSLDSDGFLSENGEFVEFPDSYKELVKLNRFLQAHSRLLFWIIVSMVYFIPFLFGIFCLFSQ